MAIFKVVEDDWRLWVMARPIIQQQCLEADNHLWYPSQKEQHQQFLQHGLKLETVKCEKNQIERPIIKPLLYDMKPTTIPTKKQVGQVLPLTDNKVNISNQERTKAKTTKKHSEQVHDNNNTLRIIKLVKSTSNEVKQNNTKSKPAGNHSKHIPSLIKIFTNQANQLANKTKNHPSKAPTSGIPKLIINNHNGNKIQYQENTNKMTTSKKKLLTYQKKYGFTQSKFIMNQITPMSNQKKQPTNQRKTTTKISKTQPTKQNNVRMISPGMDLFSVEYPPLPSRAKVINDEMSTIENKEPETVDSIYPISQHNDKTATKSISNQHLNVLKTERKDDSNECQRDDTIDTKKQYNRTNNTKQKNKKRFIAKKH